MEALQEAMERFGQPEVHQIKAYSSPVLRFSMSGKVVVCAVA